MIAWDDTMTTGVKKIDVQHQRLIEKYNELNEAVEKGLGRLVIGEILDFLQFYVTWHFGEEEECMNAYRCPVAQTNKRAHEQFVAMFGEFYDSWQFSSLSLAEVQAACDNLGDWIETHICRIDTQLYACVHG